MYGGNENRIFSVTNPVKDIFDDNGVFFFSTITDKIAHTVLIATQLLFSNKTDLFNNNMKQNTVLII